VSLSKEPVYSELKNHFDCGYRNIMNEPYAGNSGTHKPGGNAVDTTNGAGPHNIQMFVMNPDGTVVHCLPGFWNPQDLAGELTLARKLNDLYNNQELSAELKDKQYAAMQMEHVRFHSSEMQERSHLQGFDAKHEAHKPGSDFIKDRAMLGEEWGPESCKAFKTTDVVMHERMAKRPFLSYQQFDVASYSDYGTATYDKHEDSLAEDGSHPAAEEKPMKLEWIKNPSAMRGAPPPCASTKRVVAHAAPPVRKVYVHTYGQLKSR